MAVSLSAFDFELPEALIAQRPIEPRHAARLLVTQKGVVFLHRHVYDLPTLLAPGDLLVFNDTSVIPARLFGRKASGGKVEVLLERPLGDQCFRAMLRNAKNAEPHTRYVVADDLEVEVLKSVGGGFYTVKLHCTDMWATLDRHGHIPLPPYIRRQDEQSDRTRYQTMFADKPGSSAAPTAGLHFTPELMDRLQAAGIAHEKITLHVGAGTFLPVREEAEHDISQHKMHNEWFSLSERCVGAIADAKARGGRVIAVGTTSVRTLESVAEQHDGRLVAGEGETTLFITPGFRFAVIDGMITNFHLPKSTLFILVSALAGQDAMKAAYQEAISEQYRFFSYGDAMLILP